MVPNRTWLKEILLAAIVLISYSAVNLASSDRSFIAFDHCRQLIDVEQSLGIFIEVDVQRSVLGTPMVTLLNAFYAFIHPLVTIVFIIGLFLSASEKYAHIRNIFVIFSLLAFLIYLFYPSAPPRMLSEYGFIDILKENSPVSYETGLVQGILNPYAAMPSVHFGYSLIIGAALVYYSRRCLQLMLGVVYPAIMLFFVTASAHHLLIDCIAAVLLLAGTVVIVGRMGLPGNPTRFLRP